MDKKNIETILPLTALQLGFLWHSISSGGSQRGGLIQMQCHLAGSLDDALFDLAWQQTVAHHQMLRATVHWENVKKPVMVIHRQVRATVEHLSWCSQDASATALQAFLNADVDAGLPLGQAPVSRMTLIRVADQEYELVWTSHHLLLDGWSGGLILDELFARYDCLVAGTSFAQENPPGFAGYLKWLQLQDNNAAKHYWTDLLSGYETMRSLPRAGKPVVGEVSLDRETTDSVLQAVRDLRTTLNAVIQTGWACLLSRLAERQDVVFGATVSGRQNDYPPAQSLVGMLVNVLPVRVGVNPEQTLSALLQQIQAQSFSSQPHAFVDTGQIQTWSGCSGSLFDTLLTVENQPSGKLPASLSVSDLHSGIVSAYGITVVVKPGAELVFTLHTFDSLMSQQEASALLDCLRSFVIQLTRSPEQAVCALTRSPVPFLNLLPARLSPPASSGPAEVSAVPVSLLEQRVGKIWREVLGVESVGLSDSFFDLGGTSILAMVLFNRIEAEVGVAIPSTVLFQHNSLGALLELLNRDKTVPQWADVVAIQPEGELPPLFIPDTSTNLLIYRHLADELGSSQPIFGFSARHLASLPYRELAARLNKQLLSMQPDGPYYLAGMSGAGSLAWTMAQQLRGQGHVVAVLILFDCLGPGYPQLQSPVGRAFSSLQCAGRVLIRKVFSPDQDKLLVFESPVTANQENRPENDVSPRTTRRERFLSLVFAITRGRPLIEQIANLIVLLALKIPSQSNSLAWAAFMQGLWLEQKNRSDSCGLPGGDPVSAAGAVHQHLYDELEPYDGRIEFFRASERPAATVPEDYSGWRKLVAGEFVVHQVPGNHLSLIEPPNVRALARSLKSVLREVRTAGKPQD